MGSTSNTEKFWLFSKFFETAYFLSKTAISSYKYNVIMRGFPPVCPALPA